MESGNRYHKKGYVLYIVLAVVGTALITLYYLAGMNLQRNVMNRTFLLNRQAYYLLKGASEIYFSDFSQRANLEKDPLFSFVRGKGSALDSMIPSSEAGDKLTELCEFTGFSWPRASVTVNWERNIQKPGFWDPSEKNGTLSLILYSEKSDRTYEFKSERRIRISNTLPPVVSFFTLYAGSGLNGEINTCRDFKDSVSLYNGSGLVYLGPEGVKLKLTAGAEEFLLPEQEIRRYEDKAVVISYFCYSPAYSKYFTSLNAGMTSSFLNVFGDGNNPSPSFVLGKINMSYLSLSALFKLDQADQLQEFDMLTEKGKFEPREMVKPFSRGDVVHPEVVYSKERDILQVVTPDKNVSFRGEASSFNLRNALMAKITAKPVTSKQKDRFLANYLDGQKLDLCGNTVFWPGKLSLRNTEIVSPGIIIAEKGAELVGVYGSNNLTVAVLSGNVRLSGHVKAYLCLLDPSSRLLNTGISLTGGLYLPVISRENFQHGGTITYNNTFSSYYSKKNYWTIIDESDQGVWFERK